MKRAGSMSVKDHKSAHNLAASVLMFDQLIFPKPADQKERQRWIGEQWNPDLLDRRLDQLGSLAEAIPWNDEHRNRYADFMKDSEYSGESYSLTRAVIAEEDKTGRHVMAAFQSVAELRKRFSITEEKSRLEASSVVVRTQLLQPMFSKDPDTALLNSIQLAREHSFRERRQQLYSWQEREIADRATLAEEMEHLETLIMAYNAEVERVSRENRCMHFFTLFAPLCSLASLLAGDFNQAQVLLNSAVCGMSAIAIRKDNDPAFQYNCEVAAGTPIAMFHDVTQAFARG